MGLKLTLSSDKEVEDGNNGLDGEEDSLSTVLNTVEINATFADPETAAAAILDSILLLLLNNSLRFGYIGV